MICRSSWLASLPGCISRSRSKETVNWPRCFHWVTGAKLITGSKAIYRLRSNVRIADNSTGTCKNVSFQAR
jgi:hypothetical protein